MIFMHLLFAWSIYATQIPLQSPPKQKVAIIGSGVGGSFTAYFLDKLKDVDITVFERDDRIGGRIRSLNLNLPELEYVELGGTLISENNRFLCEAVKEYQLEKVQGETNQKSSFGVWKENDWAYYHSSKYGDWFASLKLLYKYGIWHGPIQAKSLAKMVGDMFMKVYDHLDQKNTWTRVEREIERLELMDYSTETCASYLEKQGINQGSTF
jgi:protoporphyrinogen oxidase